MKFALIMILAWALAGSAVANSTGAWFDPEQEGHGVSLFDMGERGKVFWWYTYHPVFGQTWLMSSVETGDEFVMYRPLSSQFPTAEDADIGEPIGTVALTPQKDGFLMEWDLLVEPQTCRSLYGPLPPGPIDPRCLDEDRRYVADRVLREGLDEQGTADLIRLTPAIQ